MLNRKAASFGKALLHVTLFFLFIGVIAALTVETPTSDTPASSNEDSDNQEESTGTNFLGQIKDPSSCDTCRIDKMGDRSRPNQPCYNETISCLADIATARMEAGSEDPMCGEDGGNCLCLDGFDSRYWMGACYEELAARLCEPSLTKDFCESSSTYGTGSMEFQEQECIKGVEEECSP